MLYKKEMKENIDVYQSHSKVSKVSSYATQDATHIPARVTK